MAKFVLTDASLVLNSVDLSASVQSITINYEAEPQDASVMGDDTRIALGGLKNWSMDITFVQDFASNLVDATLFGIVGSQVPVVVKPTSGSVSSTNPEYTGTALLINYSPVGNSVGDLAVAPVTLNSAGTLTRVTS